MFSSKKVKRERERERYDSCFISILSLKPSHRHYVPVAGKLSVLVPDVHGAEY